MSKSILVIGTPKRCLDCSFGNSQESNGEEVYCNILNCTTYQKDIYEDEEEEELYNSKKPDWCPIRNIPKKRKVKDHIDDDAKAFINGYNACIDEILKGVNKNDKGTI